MTTPNRLFAILDTGEAGVLLAVVFIPAVAAVVDNGAGASSGGGAGM